MKHLYIFLLVGFVLINSNVGLAQMVSPTNASSTSSCDGEAFFTLHNSYGPPFWSWHWENDSIQIAGADSIIANLCPGNYSLFLDSMGISVYEEPFVIGNPCANLSGSISSVTNCTLGNCDGSAVFTPTGGVAPYVYSWSNGATTQSLVNVCPGNYTITYSDAIGCSDSINISVGEEQAPFLNPNLWVMEDYGTVCMGEAWVYPSGTIAPYTMYWSTGDTTDHIYNLCAGVYSISIWDGNMDSTSVSFVIADSSTFFGGNPYPTIPAVDTLYSGLVTNCMINYNTIDSAMLYQAVYDSINQNLYVTWIVYSPTDTVYISDTLGLTGASGVYLLNISVFCPNKSGTDFFKINGAVYFDGVGISTPLQLVENALESITIFPNPFTNSISVDNKDGVIQSLKLIDLNGRVLSEMSKVNSGLVELNQLESVSSGTYLLILSGESSSKAYKVVK